LRKRAAEAAAKLMRLYEAIKNGVADLADPRLKERVAELAVIRDQSRLDADRAAVEMDKAGPTLAPQVLPPSPSRRACGCVTPKAAFAATNCVLSPNALRSMSGKFASSVTRARSCAPSSLHQAGNGWELAFPVLFRSSAPFAYKTANIHGDGSTVAAGLAKRSAMLHLVRILRLHGRAT
jgi:hypothetical protein